MKRTFGEFLAEKRKKQNLTQKELAKLLFVTESAVSKWEKNVAHPDITTLPSLCKILNVTEHELITASEDATLRETTAKAKKWSNLVFTWDWFFYISYSIALLVCCVVNIAVSETLSWFWIVFSAILLSASFTSIPKFIKKYRLLIITLIELVFLIILLGVCCIFTHGNWFFISVIPTICLFIIVFCPIYFSVYEVPMWIKKHNALISIVLDYVVLFILMLVIEAYTSTGWVWSVYLPLSLIGLGIALVMVLIFRYLKTNRFIKTGLNLLLWFIVALVGYPITQNVLKTGLDVSIDVLQKPNFAVWIEDQIGYNVFAIILMTLSLLALVFLILGIIKIVKQNKKIDIDKNN